MKSTGTNPPSWALKLFRWFCHPKLQKYIEGDLLELYVGRLKALGKRQADLRFIIDVLLLFRPGIVKPVEGHQNLNMYGMQKHYLIIGWRNLLKNRTYSLLNILGLTAGTVCCLYILLYVQEQYSFDRHHNGVDRIFRITTEIITKENTDKMATISTAILPSIQEDFPEIEAAARVMHRPDVNDHLFRTDDRSLYITEGYYADSSFFNVFTFRFVEGAIDHCLDQPRSMVISSDVARRLFGAQEAVNRIITMTDRFGTNEFTITGVFDENYGRSHIHPNFIMNIYSGRFGEFVRRSNEWAWDNNAYGYVKLKQGTDAKAFESKVTQYVSEKAKERLAELGYVKLMHLQNIPDIHVHSKLNSEIGKNSNSGFLNVLIILSVFIQLIACINFMNLSTARSTGRAKEIGVRKSAGAGKNTILWQFMTESMLMTLVAVVLALPTLYLLLPYFNSISRYNVSINIFGSQIVWQSIIGLIVTTGLFAGSYPAFYLSSFKAIDVLKGNLRHRFSAVSMRKSLVVFQFMVSVGLIVAVLIISNQVTYMQERDLGFSKKKMIVIPFRSRIAITNHLETYKNEIAKLAAVENSTTARSYPGDKIGVDIDLYKSGQTMADAKLVFADQVDESYFETLEIPLLAGRNFTKHDTLDQIIINEAAAKELGLSISKAPGQKLHTGAVHEMRSFSIVGVVRDFNFSSLHEEIKPLFFQYHPRNIHVIISFASDDYTSVIGQLQDTWKKVNPLEPFFYFFVEESLNKQYEAENTLLDLINSFTVIAISICCLGLFGLAAFTVEYRVKEIGIRKVLGATHINLVTLVSKDFLGLVVIACVITTPIAWLVMAGWLEQFAYQIEVSIWVFVIATTLALFIAVVAVSYQAITAALKNPVKNLRLE